MFLYHILQAYSEVAPGCPFESDLTILIAKCNTVIYRPETTFLMMLDWDILKFYSVELWSAQCMCVGMCVCVSVYPCRCSICICTSWSHWQSHKKNHHWNQWRFSGISMSDTSLIFGSCEVSVDSSLGAPSSALPGFWLMKYKSLGTWSLNNFNVIYNSFLSPFHVK